MKKPLSVIAREAFFIKLSDLNSTELEEAYERNTFQFFKDSACERCPYFQERPCETCEECPNNLGLVKMAKRVEIGSSVYLSMPIGDVPGLKGVFEHRNISIVPKFPIVKMKRPIKFIGKLRPEQEEAKKVLIAKRRGVLKSPPRTGKTVMAAAVVCELGYKTLIMAAQRDWLVNFNETFVGSKTQKPLTDIGITRIGFANKLEQFKNLDIALCTYQTFNSPKGQKLLKKISKMFTVLIVDEVHRSGASLHAKAIAGLATKYKIGLSGTPQRKDGKEKIMHKLMGPVIHKVTTNRLVPRIRMVETGLAPKHEYKTWTPMINYLEMNPSRLKLIAKWAVKDAKAGHSILIPMARTLAVKVLVKTINRLAGDVIAAEFYGGIPKQLRDKTIERARKGIITVVVGNTKLLSTGINIPRASCIYQCTPSANQPNAEQRFSRILTPHPDKPEPLIRVFADDMNVVKSCFRSEWWGTLYPVFKPKLDEDTREKLFNWMQGAKRKSSGFSGANTGGIL